MTQRIVRVFILCIALAALATGIVAGHGGGHALASRAAVAATNTSTVTVTPSPSSTATVTSTATASATASPTVTGTPTATATALPGGPTSAYFAEGYTGLASTNGRATFTEVLNILNPSTNAATAVITYYIQGSNTPVTVTRTVSPTTTLRESVNTDVGSDKFVASVITSPQRLFVTRTITRIAPDGTRLDGSTTGAAASPARAWGFPEGYTGVTFQQYLTILNPSNVAANVTILLAPQAANANAAKTLTLSVPALSRATANIRALNLENSAKSVGMIITSDVPIVPERVIYFGDGSGSGKFGSTVRTGITDPSTTLSIAYGSTGGLDAAGIARGNQTFITLLNPASSGAAVQVSATFFDANGRSIGTSPSVSVSSGTRQTIIANNALGVGAVSPYSVVLHASGPIEAESAQYFGGSPNVGRHPGVDFPALSSATSDAFLSELSTQQPDGADLNRFVFLYNPGNLAIQVAATYFGGNGHTVQASYSVPAGGIATVDVVSDTGAGIPPGPLGGEFRAASGSFIAYSTGRTNDGLSATEDVGVPLQ